MASDSEIIDAQVEFYHSNGAGCGFAAYAARDTVKFGWHHKVLPAEEKEIDLAIERAIKESTVSTLSLIFPAQRDLNGLLNLIRVLSGCTYVYLGQDEWFEGYRCVGFRTRIVDMHSWVSGFGPFSFFPKTRQAPYTEIVMRVKSRPNYSKTMKKSPPGVLHLADMDMLDIPDATFKQMWGKSHERTARILGHKPNLMSAAKTTFVLPDRSNSE